MGPLPSRRAFSGDAKSTAQGAEAMSVDPLHLMTANTSFPRYHTMQVDTALSISGTDTKTKS
jgi:hypothetical protein